jgi:uncharacterized membrane protein YhhN
VVKENRFLFVPTKSMKRIPFLIFLLASSLEVGSSFFGWKEIHWIAKPLIVLGLIGHYYFYSSKRSSIFIWALAFCWVGDVLLLFQGDIFFMGGLVGFLIGHVLYIVCYKQFQYADKSKELLGPQKVRFSLPIVLYGTGLVVILFPVLDDLKIPVMIYALVLTLMVLNALFRYGRTSVQSFLFVFLGAILFMASDSMLAINRFLQSFSEAAVLVMMTYCAAQFLIVEGTLAHEKSSDNS